MSKSISRSRKPSAWRWLWRSLLGLALLWLAVFFYVERHPMPDEARAMLQAPAKLPGRNAFAALWLLKHDVPASQIEAAAAQDVADYERWDAGPKPADAPWQQPSDRFGVQKISIEDDKAAPWCKKETVSCLQAVQAKPSAYAALVARHKPVWARVQALSEYDHYQTLFRRDAVRPIPAFIPLSHALTTHALHFAQTPSAQHLQAMCQHMTTVRRLSENDGSDLIFQMIGSAVTRDGTRLMVDMLNQLPAGIALPAPCTQAMEPTPDWPQAMCRAMRGETMSAQLGYKEIFDGRLFKRTAASGAFELGLRAWRWLFFGSAELNMGLYASHMAKYCDPGHMAAVRAGLKITDDDAVNRWRRALVGLRAPGAYAFDVKVAPRHASYEHRLADREAQRMAGRSWVWLREQLAHDPNLARARAKGDVATLTQALAQRPAHLQMPGYSLSVIKSKDPSGMALHLPLWHEITKERGANFDLPLP